MKSLKKLEKIENANFGIEMEFFVRKKRGKRKIEKSQIS